MEYLLVVFYTVLFCLFILKTNWFISPLISKKWLIVAFLVKLLVCFLYSYIHKINGWGDTVAFFKGGQLIANLWPNYPAEFFRFVAGIEAKELSPEIIAIIEADGIPYYGQKHSGFVVRIHAVLHILSFGYYSVHCVFFSFFSFIGIFYICSFFENKLPNGTKLKYFFVFFAPSILFWTSGVHKDALMVFGMGIILLSFKRMIEEQKWRFILLAFIAILFSLSVRSYTTLLFLPALFTYWLSLQSKKPIIVFLSMYLAGLALFFLAPSINSNLDFPAVFIQIQDEFSQYGGLSHYGMPNLKPTILSFAFSTPFAFFNTILRPWFSEVHSSYVLAAFVENILILMSVLICLLFRNTKRLTTENWRALYLCLFFGLSFYWLIGLTVTNTGAIVRYRVTGLIFFTIALISILDLDKLKLFFNKLLKSNHTISNQQP